MATPKWVVFDRWRQSLARCVAIGCLAFAIAFLDGNNSAGQSGSSRPNILVITADDLGTQLSCYGDPFQTPNMDAFASMGVKFNKGYVTQASCSSSRSSILTGKYPTTNGQLGLADSRLAAPGIDYRMFGKWDNIAFTLHDHGYYTGRIGKLHVLPEGGFHFDWVRPNYKRTRNMPLTVGRVAEFINEAKGEEKPFFLYLNFADPHTPFELDVAGLPTEKVDQDEIDALLPEGFPFQGIKENNERVAGYYNNVRRLDEGIGMLRNRLDTMGVLDDTLIFFVGDHGAPFVRGKGACYESSVHIPYFVIGPQVTDPNRESDALVSTIDIYPTICEAANITVPRSVEGQSLLPLLQGDAEIVRETLVTEFNFHLYRSDNFYPRRSITDGRYKLIYNAFREPDVDRACLFFEVDGDPYHFKIYNYRRKYSSDTWQGRIYRNYWLPPRLELYDLEIDPWERVNLSEFPLYNWIKNPLWNELQTWMIDNRDRYSDPDEVLAAYSILDSR